MSTTSSNYYIATTGTTMTSADWGGNITYVDGSVTGMVNPYISIQRGENGKISPQLYFSYVKKKFGVLERYKLDKRLKRVEAAFDEAVENGQNMLANKILNDIARETRESLISAKGITHFIERDDLVRHKHNIRGGHISDTMLRDYTRVIPKAITEKVKKLKGVFDDFVIWHYYEEAIEKKLEKKQKMTPEEKSKMRDPIIFGIIKESNRLYFVDDWEDDYCSLTFDEIVDVVGEQRISKQIKLSEK